MSQPNKNKAQVSKAQAEFSVAFSNEQTHVELTISSEQAKRLLRPLALLMSHLLAAALATASMNPALLGLSKGAPATPPAPSQGDASGGLPQ